MDPQHHQQQQQHPQHHMDMDHEQALASAQYSFYPHPEPQDPTYGMAFQPQMPNYEVVPAAPPPRAYYLS